MTNMTAMENLSAAKAPNYYQPVYRPQLPVEEEIFVPVGTKVRLNHFKGTITGIHTHIKGTDRQTGEPFWIPLRSPLYVIAVDTSQKLDWAHGARQVFCPPETQTLRLFRDEFEIA